MLYFNSQKIPELSGLNFAQRMMVIRKAADKLPVPSKVLLNIVKLLILVPLFLLMARSSGIEILYYILLLLVVYPLITRPLTFYLCRNQFVVSRQSLFPDLPR
ncbi:DUF6170 family protein [Chromatiaceae bacterium AAb-1]|jgi:hypothetical protein|nr:DUF6170 family protein [Chromatiaceae bacterium AAb-1]